MLSRLVLQRVSLRVPTPQAATAGLRLALLARQQVVARTFLTTAHVSEPAAKDSEGTKTKKSTAKKSGTTKSAAKTPSAGRKKGATTKPKARGRAKKPLSDELEARLKAPLLSVKLKKADLPPKKPAPAYSLFVAEHFQTLDKGVNHKDAFVARNKELAERWKQMSDAEKQPYNDKYEALLKDFRAAYVQWFENADPRLVKAINAQRRAKNKSAIHTPIARDTRKPLLPYVQFSTEIEHELPTVDQFASAKEFIVARGKALKEKWGAVPEEEKVRRREEYVAKLKEYRELLAKESA